MHEVFKSELERSVEILLVVHLEVEPADVVALVLSIRAVRTSPDIVLPAISTNSRSLVEVLP